MIQHRINWKKKFTKPKLILLSVPVLLLLLIINSNYNHPFKQYITEYNPTTEEQSIEQFETKILTQTEREQIIDQLKRMIILASQQDGIVTSIMNGCYIEIDDYHAGEKKWWFFYGAFHEPCNKEMNAIWNNLQQFRDDIDFQSNS